MRAANLGYEPLILSTTVEGESREVATCLTAVAAEAAAYGRPAEPPCVLISGGETTVRVGDGSGDGKGGPNQEFALTSALELAGDASVTTLALGTDGTDGPTDAAGGLVDATTVPRMRERGIDARDHLRRHDATPALRAVDDAVLTGPTGTNVMDLRLTLVEN
nr:MOFRL family protein [Haloplanus salinus]